MYLPRGLIAQLYQNLVKRNHAAAPPVLLLVALEPDALCACRILTALLRRDYIPHKIQPIAGYGDLSRAAEDLIRPMRTTHGGSGGVVVCLGVGGMVDLEEIFGMEVDENGSGGTGDVEVWLMDARRPWNLSNVFGTPMGRDSVTEDWLRKRAGVEKGRLQQHYNSSKGGIIVFDDGDIEEELESEREAYCALEEMPEVGEGAESEDEIEDDARLDEPPSGQAPRKRKSWSGDEDSDVNMSDDERPSQRRRSNSGGSIPSTPERRPSRRGLMILGGSSDFSRSDSRSRSTSPAVAAPKEQSIKGLRRQLVVMREKHDKTLQKYYDQGASYSEPVSSLVYSLASELGREDNDLLWNAIVGVSSLELYGRTGSGVGLNPLSAAGGSAGWNGDRGERIRSVLRDEVRRLNPVDIKDLAREATMGDSTGVIPTSARSATDKSIRLSPEPRFLLLRHWSLYESMQHSPYLSARLHIWNDSGRRRLDKLLAKMGVSLAQCKQYYTHMDMDLKRGLRERLLKFAPMYGLDGLVPPAPRGGDSKDGWGFVRCWGWKACLSAIDAGVILGAILEVGDAKSLSTSSLDSSNFVGTQDHSEQALDSATEAQDRITARFYTAYDALADINTLTAHISTAQHLHKAILRTGTALIEKRQIRHLKAFRMAVVKEGPDVQLFTHPGALTKLALWIAEAIVELNGTKGRNRGSELVMAGLDERQGRYVVVGLGGGGATESAKERIAKREKKNREREQKKAAKATEQERKRQARKARLEAAGLEEDEVEDESEEESEEDEESEDEEEIGKSGRNRFGNAFQEVVRETGARVRMDSFEACVIEIKKEDLSGFLERLSMKAVPESLSPGQGWQYWEDAVLARQHRSSYRGRTLFSYEAPDDSVNKHPQKQWLNFDLPLIMNNLKSDPAVNRPDTSVVPDVPVANLRTMRLHKTLAFREGHGWPEQSVRALDISLNAGTRFEDLPQSLRDLARLLFVKYGPIYVGNQNHFMVCRKCLEAYQCLPDNLKEMIDEIYFPDNLFHFDNQSRVHPLLSNRKESRNMRRIVVDLKDLDNAVPSLRTLAKGLRLFKQLR
ncbi:DNA replication initiation factor cdc45 [Didymosphaeria variabile]|uniref:DNA replication initiation factor cdc45 n=1 Tax=Didymosphaeria variabile TaxID=1932322 RepID=A0A9W8XVL9_9PLEO|nr:DNA replication initiation factor cdc45 [Didymosphaeria variabile]KAJ4360549.1 DNA replication initiation factor cdc45 [Didymosphaeria variabile]